MKFLFTLFLITFFCCGLFFLVECKSKKNHARATAAEDPAPPITTNNNNDKKITKTKVSFFL